MHAERLCDLWKACKILTEPLLL